MKRMKRDMTERAFKLGFNQGLKGHSKDTCPFGVASDKWEQWTAGWREGRTNYVAGYRQTG